MLSELILFNELPRHFPMLACSGQKNTVKYFEIFSGGQIDAIEMAS
ncbi:hypothetical protein [Pseudomonas sp. FEN]|nr:hypothetical protein [Pseudomonas sp. FEN]